MPHVITQWHSGHSLRESVDGRQPTSLKSAKSSYDIRRSAPISPRKRDPGGVRPTPSLNLLVTPGSTRWDFGANQHTRHYSPDAFTPMSGVDSVFEPPSAHQIESPNSSTHSSCIAELEDTSTPVVARAKKQFIPKPTKVSPIANATMQFKTTKISSRAVIKVVDEEIAAIEASNRELLSRVVAAEEAANSLREQNSLLQLKAEHCDQHHRPKTAPSRQSPTREPRYKSPSTTPLSNFNASFDQIRVPKPNPNKASSHAAALSQPLSPLRQELSPSPRFLEPPASQTPKPHRSQPRKPASSNNLRPPPQGNFPFSRVNKISEISTPLPGSVQRSRVTYAGAPIPQRPNVRIISLEEARREKPLPPLGPMSPSVVQGKVEIGLGIREGARAPGIVPVPVEVRKKRGLSSLFRRSRRD